MPPRFAYWTIILGGQPTAFRAAERDELLPTLKQLQSKQPDAVMKWFSRGQLWESPAEATAALRAQRAARDTRRSGPDRRGPDWRPGGAHKDPRDRFKIPRDVKRKRFADRLRRERMEGERPGRPPRTGERDREGGPPRGPHRTGGPARNGRGERPQRSGGPPRSGGPHGRGGFRSGGPPRGGGPGRGRGPNRGGGGGRGSR